MNFVEILQEYRIPYLESGHHHCTVGYLQIDCPFCSPNSQHWRLGYNLAQGFFTCWSCGSHRLLETLMELTGEPYQKCKELIGSVSKRFERKQEPERKGLVLPLAVGPLLPQHRNYLKKRKMDPDELTALWKLQGIGLSSRLAWRIFIPIQYQGQTVSWTTRSISDRGMRYLNAKPCEESIRAKSLLSGEDFARHSIIAVEGPMDRMAIGPGAVDTSGMGYTRSQVLRMSKYPLRAICFDNEPTAQKRAKELCGLLQAFPGDTFLVSLNAKDPGSASKREIKELRKRFLE